MVPVRAAAATTWRIRLTWRIGCPRGYRIFRIARIFHVNPGPGRQTSATRRWGYRAFAVAAGIKRVRIYEAAGLPHQRGPSQVICAAAAGRLTAPEAKEL